MKLSAVLPRPRDEYYIIGALLLIVIFFGAISRTFISSATLFTMLDQLPPLLLVTAGMTLVMMLGDIDLSVGSLSALSGSIIGVSMVKLDLPIPVAIALGVGAVGLVGLLSGWLRSYMGLPSFIVTLGVLEAARGGAFLVSGMQTVYIGPGIQALALPIRGFGVSPALLIGLVAIVFAQFVLTRSVIGRCIVAVGANEAAARISGINTRPYRLWVLAASGLLAGVAGLFNTSYLASADPNAGVGLELSAIAAASIGGTSLSGGRGSILGAFIGVLIIAVLQSGLAQIGASEPVKRLFTGAVIVLAVVFDRWRVAGR